MKRLNLLIIALFLFSAASAQNLFSYINTSDQFFEALNANDFKKAQSFFDGSLKDKVSPEALEKIWGQLHAQLGDFESINGAQNRSQDDFQSVILNCEFKSGSQPFQFVFNTDQKLIGFFLAPKNNAASYKLPAYADSSAYTEKFVTIKSGTHDLPAAIVFPKNGEKFPVVVMVHGSGPHDMDETVGANKPFKDLAIGLAAKGIATLRYVKRTTLYPTEFQKTYTLKEEVEDDAQAALNFVDSLPQTNKEQVYLLGHSLGGMVAPFLATNNKNLKGIILAAAPARALADISIEQTNYGLEKSKDTTAATKKAVEENILEIKRAGSIKTGTLPADSVVLGLPASYWADVNSLDQVNVAKKLKCKILVIQGGNDFQVTTTDYNLWQAGLKSRKKASFKLYPMLNHVFSFVSEKGSMNQYFTPGNVDEIVVQDIASWIKEEK